MLLKGLGKRPESSSQLKVWIAEQCPATDTEKCMNTVKTILFVENDPVALEMYRNRLQREGFHIESAQDGLEALKVLSQITPDLVVLDMMLPKLSGADVLKFMRADPRLKLLPVIVFSNAPMMETPQEAALAGPTKRLLKADCTFPMLLQSIQELLASAAIDYSRSESNTGGNEAASLPHGNGQTISIAPVSAETARGRTEFLTGALAEIPKIREHCFAYIKAPASPASLQHLPNLYQRVHFLSTNAGKAGCSRVALLTNAFDTLLSEIMVKPTWVTPSVLQTIAQAVDCLGSLLKSNAADLAQPMPQAKVLAVDDDAVCNHVIVNTLKRANFDAKSVDDPLVALQILQTNHFDLVLLDINMPDLTGFEVCEKLRRFPHCKNTPVIFITGHNNFDNRKQSVLSGGHDFITKPVSPSELALKATIHLLKARVQRAASQPGAETDTANASKNAPRPLVLIQPRQMAGAEPRHAAPASAFLPMTESRSGETQSALSPAAAAPVNESAPISPLDDPRQPAAPSIQIHQHSGGQRKYVVLAEALFPTTESSNAGMETAPPSDAAAAPVEFHPEASPETGMQPAPTGPLGQVETHEISIALSPGIFLPESESANTGMENALPAERISPAVEFNPYNSPEATLKEKEARCTQLESELAGLHQAHDEFQGKLASEQQAAAKSQQEINELQERLRQSAAELEQAKAGLEQHSSERARLESELREQLHAVKTSGGQTEAALKEKEARCTQLESELAGLRHLAGQREEHKKLISALRENVLQLHESLHQNGGS